jgi:hypothetical protein
MPAVPAAPTRPPESLAVSPAGVVRSPVKMDSAMDTQARLQRAKERLYVFCQLGGWAFFAVVQVFFVLTFSPTHVNPTKVLTGCLRVITMGLLLTHYIRPWLGIWGWKELGWRALLPRIILLGTVLSLTWCGLGYAFEYGVLQQTNKSPYPVSVLFLTSWINGLVLMSAWLSAYFFYHIFERLNRLQVGQLQLAASVKEAELRALKSQVNPHFLFNSLNSLRALIDEDAPRAREAVTRLANMLRYSLQSGLQETVPFDDEVRIVEDYLALEHIRHEDRLRVRWDIPAETRLVNVPPMLLQTLVENAVKYGIGTRREGGEIAISARFNGAVLNIRVTNPGDLSAPANPAAARAGSSTGVGLRNASDRLKLLFGERAVLTLLPEPAGCVTADVVIPLNPANP